jgi:hypothetical protein
MQLLQCVYDAHTHTQTHTHTHTHTDCTFQTLEKTNTDKPLFPATLIAYEYPV